MRPYHLIFTLALATLPVSAETASKQANKTLKRFTYSSYTASLTKKEKAFLAAATARLHQLAATAQSDNKKNMAPNAFRASCLRIYDSNADGSLDRGERDILRADSHKVDTVLKADKNLVTIKREINRLLAASKVVSHKASKKEN